jgi:protein subunit release factor A
MMIDPSDLKIEWKSDRQGGQHMNGPEYGAVTITHLPTETVVTVKDLRTQHKNREAAMRLIEFYLTDPENRR